MNMIRISLAALVVLFGVQRAQAQLVSVFHNQSDWEFAVSTSITINFDEEGEPFNLSSRLGEIVGHLKRTKITILADDGESVEVNATVFVSKLWTGGNFLGYAGLLERVRFAIDPEHNHFYFGGL